MVMEKVPTLIELVKKAVEQRLLHVHTAIIGRIEAYDHKTQMADIQPITNGSEGEEHLPLLVDVPVLFPRTGNFFISLPICKGDYVQVLFNETSIDQFLTESGSTINSAGRFTLQGAVATPGIFPQSRPIHDAHKTNFVAGRDNGVQIHIDGEKVRLGSEKADEALAIASAVKEELEKFKSAFQTHVHSYHNTPTTTQIAPIGDIATKKVVGE